MPFQIQIINSTSKEMVFEANKLEVVLTSAENDSHVVPPYNSFSAAGDVMVNNFINLLINYKTSLYYSVWLYVYEREGDFIVF